MNTQHDGGCCLIVNGEIACAVSEERLTRKRGARGWTYALRYCLESAAIRLSDLDLVVFSSYGDRLPSEFDGGLSAFGSAPVRSCVVDHHLSHAASAFFLSPFSDALIVVADGSGNEGDTESYYIGEGTRIERIGGNARLSGQGIGKTYEAFTSFLGWPMVDSGSTMALAAYGDPHRFRGIELFDVSGDQVRSQLKDKYVQGVIRFGAEAGVDFGTPFNQGANQLSRDVARLVQDRSELALTELVSNLVKKTGKRRVCLAGGVALNCLSNERIRRETGIEKLFIVPAASDKGQPLGNALYGYSVILGGGRVSPIAKDSFGRTYSELSIMPVLERRQELGNNFIVQAPPIEYSRVGSIEHEVAKLLASGKTVGWFQGGSELGSRALGHRSILADPSNRRIPKHLSTRVKQRAWFRPYAPSVLSEAASTYFDLGTASPFMLLAPQMHKPNAERVPNVVHVDGTSRPQTVSHTTEPRFGRLIAEFNRLTGIPMVLNTSFNLSGEPMVETPYDAVYAFLRTDLDYLALEDYLVWKGRPVWKH
jgi:carbamoyltransferase